MENMRRFFLAYPRPVSRSFSTEPVWQALYDVAASQEGFFATRQAAAGYSAPLLAHHRKVGRITRIRRGVYRLVHFPAGEHEDLVVAWLWAEAAAVISHQTALSLHGLSDSLPVRIHLTLPLDWRRRRLRVPKGLVLHYADVQDKERTWVGPMPVTSIRRTLDDALRDLDQVTRWQAGIRGLPGSLRLHVRLLVFDDVCRGEPLQPFRARYQVIRDGDAQDELPGKHQAEHAKAVVR